MSKNKKIVIQKISRLLGRESLAALGTRAGDEVYQSLVAFTVSGDLKNIFFATERDTRKYHNIKAGPKVALLVDNRLNKKDDFYKTIAVTAVGDAIELRGAEWARALKAHAARHPVLKDFLRGPACALFKVRVKAYYLVSHFQKVEEVVFHH